MSVFYFVDVTNPMTQEVQRHIIQPLLEGAYSSFPATDDNPNMIEYLAWVAEGNVAEPWQPEEPVTEDAN
jgi:hypothetical protein